MREFIITEAKSEEAVLVGLITKNQNEEQAREYLDELDFLSSTAGVRAVRRFTQRLDQPHSVTFVGKGKLEEIRLFVEENEIGIVIFDDELSPKQLRNIEQALKVKILDRTSLILDIFASRATTAYAKTQVELAQYRYMLPRLTACGRTSSASVGVWGCVALGRRSSRPTAVSSRTVSPTSRPS